MGAGQCLVWETVSCLVMAEPLGSLGDLRPMKSASGLMGGGAAGVPRNMGSTVGRWRAINKKTTESALCLVCFGILSTEQSVWHIVGAQEMLLHKGVNVYKVDFAGNELSWEGAKK